MQFMSIFLLFNLSWECWAHIVYNMCGSGAYNAGGSVACYDEEQVDDLPELAEGEAGAAGDRAIYFIDASCKGGLGLREACSVEAAAQANPTREGHVLFAGPVSAQCARAEPLASLRARNVRLSRVRPARFCRHAGLAVDGATLERLRDPARYTLELMKVAALYKFGGVFMSLDLVSTRPLSELPNEANWVGIGDHARGILSADALAASADRHGRRLVHALLSVVKNYRPWDGRDVMKEAVELVCGPVPFHATPPGFSFNCHGLVLYASKFFEPVPCESSGDYFTDKLDLRNLTSSFAQHLCSGNNFDKPITSDSAYAELMRRFCPKVYSHLERMGFEEQLQVIENFNDLDYEVFPTTPANTWTTEPSTRPSQPTSKWYYGILTPKKKGYVRPSHSRNSYIENIESMIYRGIQNSAF